MPDFITPNSPHKAAIFFLESRFILAILLFASVYVHKDSFPKLINKYVLVLFTIAILSVFLSGVLFYEDLLFGRYNIDDYSRLTIFILFFITIIILFTGYLYYKRAKETFQTNINYLANGSIILLVSNIVYFSYEFSGHFLIITAFLYFYLGLYKSSIELPYERLAISEEKLRRAAQDKYRRLFDNANDAVVTIDTGGRVTSWNKSAQKLFGWTAEEITGKRFVEAVSTPETVAKKEAMICELLSDTVTGQETSCMCKDRTSLDVSVTISPLLDENSNVAGRSLIFRDITEHKKSEQALRKSEEFSRTVLNSMNDSIMVIDPYDFSIISVNGFLLKKYGLKVEEVVGKKCFEVSHKITEPCYRRNEICPLLESVETGKYSTVEHVHFGKNSEKIYSEVSTSPIKDDTGKVVQIIHVARDITERKNVEQALQISEEKFLKAFRCSPIAFTLARVEDGVLVEANHAFEDITGYAVAEALGKTARELNLYPDQHECLVEMLKNKREMRNNEMHLRHKSGESRTVQCSGEFIRIDKVEYILSTTEDITERKRAEGTLRESEARLKRAHKAAHLGNWEWDLITNKLYWAEENYHIHGIDPQKVKPSYEAFIQVVDPAEHEFVNKAVADTLEGKRSFDIDYAIIRPDNGKKCILNSKADVIFDIAGKAVKMIGTVQDITDRKLAEEKIKHSLEEKEVLLREIHHRVKNNMQIVSSLLMLQSQFIEDEKYKDIFIESQTRIHSMALIHEKLYQSESIAQINFKEYIESIVLNIFESYRIKSNIKIDSNYSA